MMGKVVGSTTPRKVHGLQERGGGVGFLGSTWHPLTNVIACVPLNRGADQDVASTPSTVRRRMAVDGEEEDGRRLGMETLASQNQAQTRLDRFDLSALLWDTTCEHTV